MARLTTMKILSRTKKTETPVVGVAGIARAETHNDQLSSKLRSGEIAVIDHIDIDRVHAELLIERGVRAVVNAAPSTSGRYPNPGPQLLSRAGVTIVDHVGPRIFDKFKSGETLRLHEGHVYAGDNLIASGTELTDARINEQLLEAESGLATQLDSLAANASEHLRRERRMLLDGTGVPRLRTHLRERPVLVVSKTYQYESDLHGLRDYIADYDPVLIGAGAGADALFHFGYVPHLVVGRLAELSDRALREASKVVITSASGHITSVGRLEKAGADAVTFVGTGSSEDLAIILADTNEASVIVLAGGHTDLIEFLDRGPTDMASTFMARLRVGTRLVDAKAVTQFYNHRVGVWPIVLLALIGVIALGVAVAVTPVGQSWFAALPEFFGDLPERGSDFLSWIKGFFS